MHKFTITKLDMSIPPDILSKKEKVGPVYMFPPLSFPPDSLFSIPRNWVNFNSFAYSKTHNIILAGDNNNWEEIGKLHDELIPTRKIDPEAF